MGLFDRLLRRARKPPSPDELRRRLFDAVAARDEAELEMSGNLVAAAMARLALAARPAEARS